MPVFRVEKSKNYVTMSKAHLQDKRLSLKAKGLLSVVLSLPDNWNYSISGLCSISKESETAITSAISELKKHGYAKVIKLYPDGNKRSRIEYEYIFFENQQTGEFQGVENQGLEFQGVENQGLEFQGVENQGLEFQGVENQGQLNNNILNNNILNNKEPNTEGLNNDYRERADKPPRARRFVPPTVKEVSDYCMERCNSVDAQRFVDYYTANGWKVGKNSMKDWKAAVRTWERNDVGNYRADNNKDQKKSLTFWDVYQDMVAKGEG